MGVPDISLPRANFSLEDSPLYSLESNSSLRYTRVLFRLGTSTPTVPFPGIGATILMLTAFNASDILSLREVILWIFTPLAGCNSYLVMTGPLLTSTTFTSTPNSPKTSSRIFELVSKFSLISLSSIGGGELSKSSPGSS